MKRFVFFGVSFFCLLVNVSFGSVAYDGGNGIESDPYQIRTAEQLDYLGQHPGDWRDRTYFVLTADIDLSGYDGVDGRPSFNRIGIDYDNPFSGVFDGNGHTISNLSLDLAGNFYVGLFGKIGSRGEIKNLGVINVRIEGKKDVGAIAGINQGLIEKCFSGGTVNGNDGMGGLGIYIGGFAGSNYGTIRQCYSVASVNGHSSIGGLVGLNYSGRTISQCYSGGSVTSEFPTGGLTGSNNGAVTQCFWDVTTSGIADPESGLADTDGIVGLDTNQMQAMSTFTDAGWDFTDTDGDEADWKEASNYYPQLNWIQLQTVTTDAVGMNKASAISQLESEGFNVIVENFFSNIIAKDIVIRQQPGNNTEIPVGSDITLGVSLGPIFSGGEGTSENPFKISSPSDLIEMSLLEDSKPKYSGYFVLTGNIDMTGYTFIKAIIAGGEIHFDGIFNGNGFSVSNININDEGAGNDDLGLFGTVDEDGSVSNIRLENIIVSGAEIIGGLAANNLGEIENIYLDGSVTGTGASVGGVAGSNYGSIIIAQSACDVSGVSCAGGLVGYNYGDIADSFSTGNVSGTNNVGGVTGRINLSSSVSVSVSNCYFTGNVNGTDYVGGVVGFGYKCEIANSYFTGTVSGNNYVGGVIGYTSRGKVSGSYNSGSVTGNDNIGGICGCNTGDINDCRNMGLVTGNEYVGGIAGLNKYSIVSTISNSHNTGNIEGVREYVGGVAGYNEKKCIVDKTSNSGEVKGYSSTGGVVGYNMDGVVSSSYNAGQISGWTYIGGVAGRNSHDNYQGNLLNCYNLGDVSGELGHIGGLIGRNGIGEMTNCYSAGTVSSYQRVGGLAGSNSGVVSDCFWNIDIEPGLLDTSSTYGDIDGIDAVSTIEMQTLSTFTDAGWDFVGESVNGDEDVWCIAADGVGYPRLAWQIGGYYWGSGTADDPYQIRTAEQLDELGQNSDDWDKCFLVVADIDMSGYTYAAAVIAPDTDPADAIPLEDSFQGVPFTGVFDGGGHVISNLKIDATGEIIDYLGLFGKVSGLEAEIKNLGLENVSVTGRDGSMFVGGLCGEFNNNSKINNCYSNGAVAGGDNSICVGGLCGADGGIYITASNKCHSSGSVTAGDNSRNIGGLLGAVIHNLSKSSSTSSVSAGNGSWGVGGLFGLNNNSQVSECFASGSVTVGDDCESIGGLSGENQNGKFYNCYSTGAVAAGLNSEKIGGMCGSCQFGMIVEKCYCTGSVSAGAGSSMVFGLCDFMGGVEIKWCFWDAETDGIDSTYPGLNISGAIGMATTDMMTQSPFTDYGWDFVGESVNGDADVWRLCIDGSGYPRLAWEYSQNGDFVCGDGVDLGDFAYFAGRYGADVDIEQADLDGDGVVGVLDLCIFASHWLE